MKGKAKEGCPQNKTLHFIDFEMYPFFFLYFSICETELPFRAFVELLGAEAELTLPE